MSLFGRKTPPASAPKPAPSDAADGAPAASDPIAPSPAPVAQAPIPQAPISKAEPPAGYRPPFSDKGPEMTTTPFKPPAAPSIPGSSFKPDLPRRTVDLPGVGARKPEMTTPAAVAPAPTPAPVPVAPAADQRRLIVGRDISLSGEIGSCDILVVEGTVEAKLRDGRSIEVAESGLFKGSVEIDEADIGGRFEGDISVRGRLRVRSGGRIEGSIKYGELEVAAGGQLIGDIQVLSAAAASKPAEPAATVKPAPVMNAPVMNAPVMNAPVTPAPVMNPPAMAEEV